MAGAGVSDASDDDIASDVEYAAVSPKFGIMYKFLRHDDSIDKAYVVIMDYFDTVIESSDLQINGSHGDSLIPYDFIIRKDDIAAKVQMRILTLGSTLGSEREFVLRCGCIELRLNCSELPTPRQEEGWTDSIYRFFGDCIIASAFGCLPVATRMKVMEKATRPTIKSAGKR